MRNRFSERHAVFLDSTLEAVSSLGKVLNFIGRAQMSRLFPMPVDQIICREVSTLSVVDRDAAAVKRVKVGI